MTRFSRRWTVNFLVFALTVIASGLAHKGAEVFAQAPGGEGAEMDGKPPSPEVGAVSELAVARAKLRRARFHQRISTQLGELPPADALQPDANDFFVLGIVDRNAETGATEVRFFAKQGAGSVGELLAEHASTDERDGQHTWHVFARFHDKARAEAYAQQVDRQYQFSVWQSRSLANRRVGGGKPCPACVLAGPYHAARRQQAQRASAAARLRQAKAAQARRQARQ